LGPPESFGTGGFAAHVLPPEHPSPALPTSSGTHQAARAIIAAVKPTIQKRFMP
jgi:hypothetical protein